VKILQLPFEITLTYTWSNNNHGICGHTFEVIEYFWILKNHFNVGILLAEDITEEDFRLSITDKYDFNEDEVNLILSKTIFHNRPSLVKADTIIFTDGGKVEAELLCNKIIKFACGNKEVRNNIDPKTYILQDDRVYDEVAVNGINYKKKILFSRLKEITQEEEYMLVYGTKNCRIVSDKMLIDIQEKYNRKMIVLTQDILPFKNLFSMFSTYVYTPVPRKFDCSPRFLAECKYYNKEVIFWDIDYWETDLGLFWRVKDIENDFQGLHLLEDDSIIQILKDIN